MTKELFNIDVSSDTPVLKRKGVKGILRSLVGKIDDQNDLLEELIQQNSQSQRRSYLLEWRRQNPKLATRCKEAARKLSETQQAFISSIIDEINEADDMEESEFLMNEFADRFGNRLANLNGILQALMQLGG